MSEGAIREEIVRWGKSLFERGLTSGSSGNISVRTPDGYLAAPTNSCLEFLEPDRLSKLDAEGRHIPALAYEGTASAFWLLSVAVDRWRRCALAFNLCDGVVTSSAAW